MTKLNDLIRRGTTADMPAVTEDIIYYYDTDASTLYRNSGSAWESIEGTGPSSPYDQDEIDTFPGCVIYNSSNISIADDDTSVRVTFDTDLSDTFSMHSTTELTDKIFLPMNGSYIFLFQCQWAAGASGKRQLDLYRNSTSFATNTADPGGGYTISQQVIGILLDGAESDIIQVGAYQNNGAALNMNFTTARSSPTLYCYFLGAKYP